MRRKKKLQKTEHNLNSRNLLTLRTETDDVIISGFKKVLLTRLKKGIIN